MNPADNTEDFVRRGKAKVATDPQMDRRVLNDSLAAMDEAIGGFSTARMILRSRVARLAAAAGVVLAIGLLAIQLGPSEQEPPARIRRSVAKSPADMLSAMSLNMAFRRGGIEEVDNVSSQAFEILGSEPAKVSLRELLTESNGA